MFCFVFIFQPITLPDSVMVLHLICCGYFLQEVLSYDSGYVIFLHVDSILQKSEFPGNPRENLILLATFLPLTASFTGKVTHHLRFQQVHLGLF